MGSIGLSVATGVPTSKFTDRESGERLDDRRFSLTDDGQHAAKSAKEFPTSQLRGTPAVAIIGGGAAGTTLGRLLRRAGYRIAGVACRSAASARRAARFIGAGSSSDTRLDVMRPRATDDPREIAPSADIVLLTVPDGAIEGVARRLAAAGALRQGAVVIHCCGCRSREILRVVRSRGAFAAAIHPLRSFTDPRRATERFPGTFCAWDADPKARGVARGLIRRIGGIGIEVSTSRKARYHAAAVFASNYVAAVMAAALKLFRQCGILERDAYRSLLTLARGTLTNIEAVGLPAALTGPIERGDTATVKEHIRALSRAGGGIGNLYRRLGIATVDLALAKGRITSGSAAALRRILGIGTISSRFSGRENCRRQD